MSKTVKKSDTTKKTGAARSVARLGAVQALYQMDMNGEKAAAIVDEFVNHRLDIPLEEGMALGDADRDFFIDIIKGVEARAEEIDGFISGNLAKDWSLPRIESVVRAILRAGTYELIGRPDIPTPVVIDEYVEVAKAFHEDTAPSFVNGVLDKLARKIRNID